MTDYGRHLEEIAREIERLTFECLQEFLIQAGIGESTGETAVKLLMQWEAYQDVKDTSTQTMDEEVKQFLRKTAKLQELLNIIKHLPQYNKGSIIEYLGEKIKIISDSVKTDGSLNAGGKFEWVDSILVKCLQDGSWLLIDNVNLCSSAVLDRLNALLEPRGVLTISERGVKENGQMVEIKPHPDFRLFLTMDPKNGEISRAMRNRGVEIYLLRENEMIGTENKFDIMSLIHLEGLRDTKHIVILLKIHGFLSDLILGEKPQLSDILHAASLISKELNHGADLLEAFLTTFIEVYYKTRPSVEFNCDETVTVIRNKIEEIIRNELSSDELTQQILFTEDVTLKSQNIERCSAVEKIHQQAVVLKSCLKSSKDEHYLLNFLNSCINFFTMASAEDMTKIDLFYNELISKHPELTPTKLLIESLQMLPNTGTDLPLDLKWLPNNTFENQSQNKWNLILQFAKYNCLILVEVESVKDKPMSEHLSILQYSQLPKYTHHILATTGQKLRNAYMAYLKKIITEVHELNDEHFIHILHLLHWDWYFFKHSQKNLRVLDAGQKRNFQNEFITLYKWFCKHSVKELSTTTGIGLTDDLETVINVINEKLKIDKNRSGFRKISGPYQKTCNKLHSRFPFSSHEEFDNFRLCTEVNKYFNICDKRNDSLRIISIFKQMKELRPMLINAKKYLALENAEVASFIRDLKSVHEKAKELRYTSPSIFETQLYPILDVFLQMQIKNTSGNVESLTKNILLPTDFCGALIMKNELSGDTLKLYFLYLLNSISTKPSKYLESSPEGSEIKLNLFSPRITYFLTFLFSDNKERSNMVTLGNYRERMKQHSFLNHAIWNNMYQLSEEKYDYLLFEEQNLNLMFRRFINEFTKCMGISNTEDNSIENSLTKIHDVLKIKQDDPVLSTHTLNLLLELVKIGQRLFLALPQTTNLNTKLYHISYLYHILGMIKITLNSDLSLIDPIIKKAMKKRIINSSIEDLERMKESYIFQNKCVSNSAETVHPHWNSITNEIALLTKTYEIFGCDPSIDGIRPKDVRYSQLKTVIKYGLPPIYSDVETKNVLSSFDYITDIETALSTKGDIDYDFFISKLPQYESNIITKENVLHEWATIGEGYPDIMDALLENLAEVLYGYHIKVELLKKLLINYKLMKEDIDINAFMLNIVKFPVLDEEQNDYLKYLEMFTSNEIGKLVFNVLKEKAHIADDKTYVGNQAKQAHVTLLKCAIHETFNLCVIEVKNADNLSKLLHTFLNFVKIFLKYWDEKEAEEETKQKEAESLYKTRTKCDDEPEEKQIEEELKELFPNYHDIDFTDFQASIDILDDTRTKASEDVYKISYDDLKFVFNLHSILIKNYTKTEWLNPVKDKNIRYDFIGPLMEKYKVFSLILEETVNGLDYKMDSKLIGSLNVLLAVAQRYGDTSDLSDQPSSPSKILTKKSNNFYKDSNVEEVKNCYHILEELKTKITEFLEEWPDQPTLKTILEVIDRIYTFNINSPISRFLTGFEILLKKCHEWEEVAHSGVSLGQFYKSLIDQVIDWRKLELSMWKDLLNQTYSRLNESLPKWWFYLHKIALQFAAEKTLDKKQLVESLESFIVKSNLAEFHGRLELLYIFHCQECQVAYFQKTEESETFRNVLWNLYSYFQQFESTISNRIKDLRAPIEKKLKDYVKIVRWKDINYWSVKETIDKSHKILHKFVREFQEALQQPVSPCLSNIQTKAGSENVGIWDRPQRQNPKTYHYSLDADAYIVKQSLFKKIQFEPLANEDNVLSKSESYFLKSRKICKEIISATEYPSLVQSLDSFVTEIIETSNHLQNLEVDTSLPKHKQKSQAKNILQQKHRAIADLFKSLSKIGLSFRSGIVQSKLKNPIDDYCLKPIDLSANFSHINYGSTEEKMLTIWDSCEMYYFRSIMRANVLDTALVNPAKDLGLQNAERCKGFIYDLLNFAQMQKEFLTKSSRVYYYLRYYIKQINSFCEGKDYLHIITFDNIKKIIQNIRIVMHQYKIILNTCPEDEFLEHIYDSIEMPILGSNSDHRITSKDSSLWPKAINLINHILNTANKIQVLILKARGSVPSVEFPLANPTFIPVSDKSAIENNLTEMFTNISELKNIFGNIPLTNSLVWLENEINKTLTESHGDSAEEVSVDEFKKKSEKLMEKILVVMQNIYRKYFPVEKEETQAKTETEETENQLCDEHLSKLLFNSLLSDINLLEMPNILKRTHKLTALLMSSPPDFADKLKPFAYQFLPLLEQLVQTFQFFITQQVSAYRVTCKMSSILLNIFIELASKGFCVPPEFSDELDSEGVSKPSDGLGLGEGEGERDVSDKIESEDQLEEAQPAGQEKNQEEDKECREEDKGIEMSEDFDSKLQDKEEIDNDNNDNGSSNESDAEEQMGETGKGADQLDQELWGSDKEEEAEGDDAEQKEEKGNKGEQQGDEQLGAKDEESVEEGKQNEPDVSEEREKNKKDINELEEPEYDDDQVDPHHGKLPELPEPEPMDLPDDLQLDEGQENEDQEKQEENPFDIDNMKEENKSDDKPDDENKGETQIEQKNDEVRDFSSDDEDITKEGDPEFENEETENMDESNKQEEEKSKEAVEAEDNHEKQENKTVPDQTQSFQENIEAMEVDDIEAADKAENTQCVDQKSNQPIDELCQEDQPDNEGVGQSQMEESKTGHSAPTTSIQKTNTAKRELDEDVKKQKPGESDSQRSLGDVDQPVKKKLKTIVAEENKNDTGEENNEYDDAEMYQHIKDAKESATQVLDVATEEQIETQKTEVPNKENEEAEKPTESSDDLPIEQENKVEDHAQAVDIKNVEGNKDKTKKRQHPEGEVLEEMKDIEIEGDVVETSTVQRNAESTHYTQFGNIVETTATRLTVEEITNLRSEVEKQLSTWNEPPGSVEADEAWQRISSVTSALAQDLSEKLRLILEPTQASRLKGDFRTGRRINMRKVIPYIASQFRKDKIWLRRTKPSKREYQIVIAIDDSSSMADNHSKELAFESVSLLSKALTLLESGQLSVISFGEQIEIIHKLVDQFSDRSGVKLLQKFQFNQDKTCVAKLVDFATEMLNQLQSPSNVLNAKLLIIVSDGRGVFSEGETNIRQAVRRAKLSNIFMVFVIIDSPENKNSILDIRMPVFKDGKLLHIQSYMDVFPFSFYIILRDINSLPNVLSDALRQWFEIVSNSDN